MLPAVEALRLALDFIRPRDKVHLFSGPSADLQKVSKLFGLTKKDVPDAVLFHYIILGASDKHSFGLPHYFPFNDRVGSRHNDPLPGSDDERRWWFREMRKFMQSDYNYSRETITDELTEPVASPDIVYAALTIMLKQRDNHSAVLLVKYSSARGFMRCLNIAVARIILENLACVRKYRESAFIYQEEIALTLRIAQTHGFKVGFEDNIFFKTLDTIWVQRQSLIIAEVVVIYQLFWTTPDIQNDAQMRYFFRGIKRIYDRNTQPSATTAVQNSACCVIA